MWRVLVALLAVCGAVACGPEKHCEQLPVSQQIPHSHKPKYPAILDPSCSLLTPLLTAPLYFLDGLGNIFKSSVNGVVRVTGAHLGIVKDLVHLTMKPWEVFAVVSDRVAKIGSSIAQSIGHIGNAVISAVPIYFFDDLGNLFEKTVNGISRVVLDVFQMIMAIPDMVLRPWVGFSIIEQKAIDILCTLDKLICKPLKKLGAWLNGECGAWEVDCASGEECCVDCGRVGCEYDEYDWDRGECGVKACYGYPRQLLPPPTPATVSQYYPAYHEPIPLPPHHLFSWIRW